MRRVVRLMVLAVCAASFAAPAALGSVVTRSAFPASEGNVTEAAISVDGHDPSHIAVGAVDYAGYVLGGAAGTPEARVAPTCRMFTTADGGGTWRSEDFPNAHLPASPYLDASNPSVSISADGRVHAVCLPNNENGGAEVVYAAGGFGDPLTPATLPLSLPQVGPVLWPDKPWIATSRNGNDVTVAWGQFVSDPGFAVQVVIRTSHDGGATFGQEQIVGTDAIADHPMANAATPFYRRDGQLLVAWHASTLNASAGDVILVSDPARPNSTVVAMSGVALMGVKGSYPRHANQPSVAEDRTTGRLYLAAGTQTDQGVRATLTTSDDGGATWSAPVIVHPEPAGHDQLNAAVGVAGDGTVGVVYQDVAGGRMTTEMALRPVAGAADDLTLSTVPTPVQPYTDTSSGTTIGDFLSVAPAGDRLVAVWPEVRGNFLQLQMASVSGQ